MANRPNLNEGALAVMLGGGKVENPIMQVLGSKKIAGGTSEKERYRLLLSDGKYLFSFAMVAPQSSDIMSPGSIPMFSIIKIRRYVTSVINNAGKTGEKRILVIMDYEVVTDGDKIGHQIGDPVRLPDENEQQASTSKTESKASNGNSNFQPPPAKKPNLSSTVSTSNNTSLNESILDTQRIFPIGSLSPYQNRWVIKARVVNKTPVRTWSNSRGEGKLFSMDLLDESGEIRVTAFKAQVDQFFDYIQVDKVYFISKCQLKVANKQFSTLNNDYEMTLTAESVIQECPEDETNGTPTTQFNFVTIDKIANMEVGAFVDVIGICKQASEILTFTAKTTGRELKKRELILVDMSKTSIALTLWGGDAENYNQTGTPVVAVKGARIGEFGGGKNISAPGSSIIKYNPDVQEAFVIRGWYDNGGDTEEATNISARTGGGNFNLNWISFKEARAQGLGTSEKGDYYQTKATILLIRTENFFYKSCPQEGCNKKIVDMENNHYRCEKCNMEYPNFKYRLLGNVHVGDWSDSQWVSMFNEQIEKLVGRTAQEIGELNEVNPEEAVRIMNEAVFQQVIMRCRAKMETYNDEGRLKTVAVQVSKINRKEFNNHLIAQIQQLTSC